MFNLFPKFGSPDDCVGTEALYTSIKKEANDLASGVVNGVYEIIALKNELQHQLDENAKLKEENKNLEDILKSIQEDGTTEHNNAINLRQQVSDLKAFQEGLIHERDTARDLLAKLTKENDNLKKDVEDQKQLKNSLQRVNEKYIKKITEQEDFLSDLAKEIKNLRHLKTENVELIERLRGFLGKRIEKDGNSYGITFNEAKTQIIQNDYKKCAEERDEYKHQLDAANKEIEALKLMYKERETKLKTYNKSLQCQIISLKEEKEKQKHPMYPLHWGGYDKNIIDFVESEFSNKDPLEGKQVEFNSEELLKRVTEYADSLDTLPKSFPDEFQEEKSWEEAASDLALRVVKLERMVEELKVVRVNNNLNLDLNYEFFKKNGKWPWQWNEAESLNEKLYD